MVREKKKRKGEREKGKEKGKRERRKEGKSWKGGEACRRKKGSSGVVTKLA
jgi:hypothetical protein